jgi:hypothetical protein
MNASKGIPYKPAYPPHDFTYIHVRKVGGMTMKFMLHEFRHSVQGEGYVGDECYTVKGRKRIQENGLESFVSNLQSIAKITQFYTFLRNPIEKFLSGMGQLMSSRPKSVAALNCGQDPITAPAEVTLRCVIDALKSGDRVDEHLCLQSHELYQALVDTNVSVAVLPLDKLDEFIVSLGIDAFVMNDANQPQKLKYKGVHLLDDNMVDELCQIYAADVHMLRLVGMAVPECDEHVPWKTS